MCLQKSHAWEQALVNLGTTLSVLQLKQYVCEFANDFPSIRGGQNAFYSAFFCEINYQDLWEALKMDSFPR